MQNEFWHQAWAKSDKPGWQQPFVNQYLVDHWAVAGALPSGAVFVPLCGRSLDMQWLYERGHHIVGIDLSVAALEQFCKQQSIAAVCERDGDLTVFRAPGWTLFAGDFFKLSKAHLHQVCCVYDRAALIALPPPMREKYAGHMMSILPNDAKIFAVTITYDQAKMKGPPFSVSDEELQQLYGERYRVTLVQSDSGADRVGNLASRGVDTLRDACLLLQPKVSRET